MTSDDSRSTEFNPTRALADADGASRSMVESTDAPRGFMVVFVALVATFAALVNTVPWLVILSLGALSVPLFLWYHLVMRKRPKRRPVLERSRPYMGYFLLFYLVLFLSGYWVPDSWGEVAAKWLVVFALAWTFISLARRAELKNRLKDAHESCV
ncbi:hypothetical protein [Nesterenkonia sandarakina]|uniref:Phosphatidylglycerophosphate synthase n=1 Tax=Nesterenkonia sandarakina TaxID=272918 RepID=A0A7Z0J4T7_9MICC|nr:hypothetical protein [Nesterenkonia sandarakina]NYJ18173.1 phosphatidylglycerophosphate synthase [Nesterenkonia sandarakina]